MDAPMSNTNVTSSFECDAALPRAVESSSRWGSSPIPMIAAMMLFLMAMSAVFAPWLAPFDPIKVVPALRLQPMSSVHLLGTDAYGRDILSRLLYGGRVSLVVGFSVALLSITIGMMIGLVSGFYRYADAVIMRVMDGLMSIPNILLAVSIVALAKPSLLSVIVAIVIPEVPRVVRLTRSVVLVAREEPYVEAARAAGSSTLKILLRHIAPNAVGPLIVQGTFTCAAAVLTEAGLSFLGTGINPETPSWGNMMAEGRIYFQLKPSMIFYPGLALSVTILSMNLLGDRVRTTLDPRMRGPESHQ